MSEEIKTMHDRRVWHLVPPPANKPVIGNRWVFTVKRDENGNIVRFKSRLVAQGFKQIKGENYDETFSPVVDFSVVRLFFSILVSNLKWSNIQADVKAAYLYAPLSEEIYMRQPLGFVDESKVDWVCKLDRAIYGLHQSGRLWFYELNSVLIELGFVRLESCNCVYYHGNNTLLLVYVDDIVIFGRTQSVAEKTVDLLKTKFDLKIMGRTTKLLGVNFEYSEDSILIHQSDYIGEVFKRFKDFNPSISSLPISKAVKYSKSDCSVSNADVENMSKFPYRSVLGCLSFLASRTRPDISYAVNIFSQFQENPGMLHWNGLLRLLGYVNYTSNLKLHLFCKDIKLFIFSDADFASNRDDRISMSGQILFLDRSPISWRTNKQKSITLSTMESEFVSMCDAVRELIWFDNIIRDCVSATILQKQPPLPVLYADNQPAIDFTKSPIENRRSRHIDVKLLFIREWLFEDKFKLHYISSKSNLADPFTKPLTKYDLKHFISQIFLSD